MIIISARSIKEYKFIGRLLIIISTVGEIQMSKLKLVPYMINFTTVNLNLLDELLKQS